MPEESDRTESVMDFKKSLKRFSNQSGYDRISLLSDKSSLSRSTISEAFSSNFGLPSARTVHAIIRATGGDTEAWLARRDRVESSENTEPPIKVSGKSASTQESTPTPTPTPTEKISKEPGASSHLTRKTILLSGGAVVLLVTAGTFMLIHDSAGRVNQSVSGNSATTESGINADLWTEQTAIPDNPVTTLSDPLTGAGLGRKVNASETVLVSCRIFSDQIPSAIPDGWFYRLESDPWNGRYYAAANSFLNGDPPGDPTLYVTPTDMSVPICP